MEARLFRLTVVIAILALIVWCILGVGSYRDYRTYLNEVDAYRTKAHGWEAVCASDDASPSKPWNRNWNKGSVDGSVAAPTYGQMACANAAASRTGVEQATINAGYADRNVQVAAFWAIVFPSGLMMIFYACRWIITGKLRPFVTL